MGSKRKRQEKKKDFQKTKLRVGKTAAKPDNYTDTSFTARTIALPSQSIARPKLDRPHHDVDLAHHLQLTKHHLAATRKEVLAYIEGHLPSTTSLYKQILTLTLALISDPSAGVRAAFVSLLAACADKQPGFLELHMRSIVLFVHSAMSHIQSEIRGSSTAVLDVLVRKAPQVLVKGHFVKTLRSYFALMAWTLSSDKGAVSLAVNTSVGGKKSRATHLAVLQRLLRAALFTTAEEPSSSIDWAHTVTVHAQTSVYMLPANPLAYGPLKLFADDLPSSSSHGDLDGAYSLQEIDSLSTEDQATRRKIVFDVFLAPLRKNLEGVAKEGGETGKEATGCLAVLDRFEADYAPTS